MKYWYASAANLLALSLLPLLIIQGKRTRRTTPRLPEAAGARQGCTASLGTQTIRLLAIGESPVAGVGVTQQQEAITSCFAQALAVQQTCQVNWRAVGKNGATISDAIHQLLPQLTSQADIVLVAFGVNDTSAFRSLARFEQDLRQLLHRLIERCQPRLVLVSGLPPVGHLLALPQPLRSVLGLKAAALDAGMRSVLHATRQVGQTDLLYVPLAMSVSDTSLLASDGYHPSAKACQLWGESLAHAVGRHWAREN